MPHDRKKQMDMSLGDPLESFDFLARDAFERSLAQNHKYQLMGNNWYLKSLYEPVQDFLCARGFKSDGWHGIPNSDLLFTGGGTTQAYSLILKYLARDVDKQNDRLSGNHKIKPVILMPTPTYGMFFPQARKAGIEIVKIPRDLNRGGVLEAQTVHDTIEHLNAAGKRVVAYYDSNPHNPLGLIREEEETRKLARLFNYHSHRYEQQDRGFDSVEEEDDDAEIAAEFQSAPSFEADILGSLSDRMYWGGPASRIRMIDDMVYWGLEHKGAPKPFSFAQVDGQAYKDSFVLFGPSKAGMAAARAGLIYAQSEDIHELKDMMMDEMYSPTGYAFHAMSGYFNDDEPYKTMRKRHLDSLNAKHEFSGRFMKALINGLSATDNVTDKDQNKMAEALVAHAGFSEKQAKARLQTGIEGVDVVTSPQAGFFHMLDFSALNGRLVDNEYTRKHYIGETELDSEAGIHHLFRALSMSAASGTWTGMGIDQMLIRVTFALPPEDVIEFTDRLEELVSLTMTPQQVEQKKQRKFSL